MAVLEQKTINGKTVTEFKPDPKMLLFSYAVSCDPKYIGQAPEDVLNGIGLRRDYFSRWQRDYNPYFEEWLEGIMLTFRGTNVKKMIEFVGLQKAFGGEFNFWKAFALRERVIAPDQVNHGLIPATLGVYSEWDESQVEQHRITLLEALRGEAVEPLPALEEPAGHLVAEQAARQRPEIHPRRITEMPEESLALDEGLGVDRERPSFEPEPF